MYKLENLSQVNLIIIPLCFISSIYWIKKGVKNLKIANGFRKDNMATTTGNLVSKEFFQNSHIGEYKYDLHYEKQWTQYQYTYHVNGKSYDISGGTPFDPKKVAKSVTVTYQRSAPEYAIIPDIHEPKYENNGYKQLIGGILLTVFAILLSVAVLMDYFGK